MSACSNNDVRLSAAALLAALLVTAVTVCSAQQLRRNYYASVCPNVESIVRDAVARKYRETFITVGATVHLFFHDCFVEGCDASVVVASTPNATAEKDHPINLSLAGDGFDTVIRAKAAVDAVPRCRNRVSCADILAMATRDAIALAGGPSYAVELGRLDGLSSTASSVDGKLAPPSFMSVTVSTPTQICNSPLNASKAKMLYSFPKSTKEMNVKKSDCNQAFYDLPEVRSTRKAAFGYGTKSDFTKSVLANPPPTAYDIKSIFEAPKKRGFSFGLSRDAMLVTGGQFVGDKNSPGPGAYDTRETNKTKLSYSFRPRTTVEPLTSPKFVPGPGTYPIPMTINERGKYYNAKFKNSCATLFSPPRSKRFDEVKPGFPGPGTYENTPSITTDGSYYVSKFKSSMCRTFSHSMRKEASKPSFATTPGPGSYKLPSEFGHYESAKVNKSQME